MSNLEQWKPFFAMIGVDFALAVVNLLLKKVLDEGINYLTIVLYRQSISAIFLIPVAYFMESLFCRKGRPKLTAVILCSLFFSALIGATLTQYFFLLGLQYTSATFTCAFINIVPVKTFVLALPFGLEKVKITSKGGKAKVLGTLIAVGGTLILTLYKGVPLTRSLEGNYKVDEMKAEPMSKKWGIGSILLAGGSVMWASWFLLQAKIGKRYPFQYSSTAIMSSFSALQTAILALIIDRNFSSSTWVVKGKLEILSLVYAGMVGSGLCYVVMAWCVKKRGPVFTSAFSPFIQAFAAVFDVSILHEQIHLGSVVGSMLVVAGMYILLWGKCSEADDNADGFVTKHAPKMVEEEDCGKLSYSLPVGSAGNNV
ncbi:hypothetical protein NMG60_11009737 [Bertholletia excelsa]